MLTLRDSIRPRSRVAIWAENEADWRLEYIKPEIILESKEVGMRRFSAAFWGRVIPPYPKEFFGIDVGDVRYAALEGGLEGGR